MVEQHVARAIDRVAVDVPTAAVHRHQVEERFNATNGARSANEVSRRSPARISISSATEARCRGDPTREVIGDGDARAVGHEQLNEVTTDKRSAPFYRYALSEVRRQLGRNEGAVHRRRS